MTPKPSISIDFQTIPELAQQWRVSEGHIYNLVKKQELPAVRIGGRLIVRLSDAKTFLERNATVARAA